MSSTRKIPIPKLVGVGCIIVGILVILMMPGNMYGVMMVVVGLISLFYFGGS